MTGPRPAERRWSPFEEKQLRDLLEAGLKTSEIALKLKRTPKAVYLSDMLRPRRFGSLLIMLPLLADRRRPGSFLAVSCG